MTSHPGDASKRPKHELIIKIPSVLIDLFLFHLPLYIVSFFFCFFTIYFCPDNEHWPNTIFLLFPPRLFSPFFPAFFNAAWIILCQQKRLFFSHPRVYINCHGTFYPFFPANFFPHQWNLIKFFSQNTFGFVYGFVWFKMLVRNFLNKKCN